MSTLTQEVSRRLINTSEDLIDDKLEIMEKYCEKLKRSGYNKQVVIIITSGVQGYTRRKERLGKLHREGWETASLRESKKLSGKLNWFKNKLGGASTETKDKHTRNVGRQLRNNKHRERREEQNDDRQPSAVLFLRRTPNGDL